MLQSEARLSSHNAREREEAVAFARCAAAAVDGFSYAQVPLHAVLALQLDAPSLQVGVSFLLLPLKKKAVVLP